MSKLDESLIRDPDLREKLEKTGRGFGYESLVRVVIREQERRDQSAAADKARADALADLPRGKRRRAVIREVIENEPTNPQNLRHIHSVLALCGLPYTRQPIDIREYHRKQGRMSLIVKAGELLSPQDEWIPQPLPYGSRARLLLLHLCSEAIRQKSPNIEIEESLTAFVRAMGYPDNGGPRGALTAFKQQLNALAACFMKIGTWNGTKSTTITTAPFASIELWFPTEANQRILWPSSVTFSREFYDTLSKHALPANTHAVKAFSASPRKLDLYFWLIYRLNIIADPLRVPWEGLTAQFGGGYGRERDFRKQLSEDMTHLLDVFPKLSFKLTDEGLLLQPGSPDILAIPAPRPPKKP